MELRHLRYFLSVASTHHFTQAAHENYVAQSALSQQIANLEKELGVRLFDRTSRTVTLTEAGTALVPLAQRVLTDVEAAHVAMADRAGLQRGSLRVGLIQSHVTSIDVIDIIGTFHAAHPGIDISVASSPSSAMVEAVSSGKADAAFVGLDATEVPRTLACESIAVEPLVAVVSTSNPLAKRSRVCVTDLVEAGRFIHFSAGSGLRARVESAFERAGIPAQSGFEVGQIRDMVDLAARDVGVTLLPRAEALTAQHTTAMPFSLIPLSDKQALHPVSLIHATGPLSPITQAFVDEVHRRVRRPSQARRRSTPRRPSAARDSH